MKAKFRKCTVIGGHTYCGSVYERNGGQYYTLLYHDKQRPRKVYEMYHTPLFKVARESLVICGPRGIRQGG